MNRYEERIEAARTAFEAGFRSNAAQKDAISRLNRAYCIVRDMARDAIRDHAFTKYPTMEEADSIARGELFRANDLPFDLHQVRYHHVAIIEQWTGLGLVVREMFELREAINVAEIAPAPARIAEAYAAEKEAAH